jgi:predicted kinase
MSTLIITRGLPASGKTTHARRWVNADPRTRIRLNRDELRRMLHADTGQTTNGLQENLITKIQHDTARQALRSGVDVIVDDTNLRGRTAADWATLADVVGAQFEVVDLTHVDVKEALRRNYARPWEQQVPDGVIETMNEKFLNGRPLPHPTPRQTDTSEWIPYAADPALPTAYLVDIDGTVAIKGDRDIYDGSKAHLDTVNEPVAEVIRSLSADGHRMVFMSGRSDEHRGVTEQWLITKDIPVDELYMRAAGDHRKDSTVKHELFDKHVRYKHNVLGVFDDRNQVVEMWRAISLTVFQVADGNF